MYKTISENTPSEAGLAPFCNWTAPLACQFVKNEFHVQFSERGMRDVFYRLGLSYTRPTYTAGVISDLGSFPIEEVAL